MTSPKSLLMLGAAAAGAFALLRRSRSEQPDAAAAPAPSASRPKLDRAARIETTAREAAAAEQLSFDDEALRDIYDRVSFAS